MISRNIQMNKLFFISALIFLYVGAWTLQNYLGFEPDTCWLLYASKFFLEGGTYTKNFFDPDPPMILYLYTPIIFLTKLFAIKLNTALRIYVFFLTSLSLGLCYFLANKIFSKRAQLPKHAFLLGIVFISLVLPMNEFGQRDHLTIILVMPYFLLIAYRLQGYAVNSYTAIFIGLLAGLGFAIKPFFLVPFVLVEFMYMAATHDFWGWIRLEVLTIAFILFAYLAIIYIYHNEYIFVVVPFAMRRFYQAFNATFEGVIYKSLAIFCYIMAFLCILFYKINPYRVLTGVLYVALIGFLFSYYVQQNGWFHHIFPAYAVGILLGILLVAALVSNIHNTSLYLFIPTVIILSIVFFLFSMALLGNQYLKTQERKEYLASNKVFAFLQQNPKSDYFISDDYYYPEIEYLQIKNSSRFPFLWMMRDFYSEPANQTLAQSAQLKRDKDFLVEMIADDLKREKPQFVFVKISMQLAPDFFLTNRNFAKEWEHYHYLTTLESVVNVYQRS